MPRARSASSTALKTASRLRVTSTCTGSAASEKHSISANTSTRAEPSSCRCVRRQTSRRAAARYERSSTARQMPQVARRGAQSQP